MFSKENIHLVPPQLQDKAAVLLGNGRPEVKENYAKQFEVVKAYCESVLETYQGLKGRDLKRHRVKSVIG